MKLKEFQQWKNLSNKELADLIGISEAMMSRILSGQRRGSPELAHKIEQVSEKAVTLEEVLFK